MQNWLLPIAAVIIIAAIGTLTNQKKKAPINDESPENFKGAYKKIDILTKNEYAQYKSILPIAQALGLTTFTKVRLADLIEPTSNGQKWKSNFARIRSKHCDFVLCDSLMNTIAVIEIDDASHERKDRIKRDDFVNFILEDCGIKVLRYKNINQEKLKQDLMNTSAKQLLAFSINKI